VIVRWGLAELPGLLRELGVSRPYLLATSRWYAPVEAVGRWSELPTERVDDVAAATVAAGADGLLALGGGSTIDAGKAVSAATGLPLVSVPTTYSGAEGTTFFGVRDGDRKLRGGGRGSNTAGIVYDVDLTMGLPLDVSGGTALNALAHCAEALYVVGRDSEADPVALEGAELISEALPEVLERPDDREARNTLLHGAALGGEALGRSGLALGHAMAQAIGGTYGLPHGALNAICLPPALRFNREFVPDELLDGTAADRAAELARLAGFTSLGALGVPEEDLPALAAAAAQRAGALANPRPASADAVEELLRSVY
jgi:maleylacetate reductase